MQGIGVVTVGRTTQLCHPGPKAQHGSCELPGVGRSVWFGKKRLEYELQPVESKAERKPEQHPRVEGQIDICAQE